MSVDLNSYIFRSLEAGNDFAPVDIFLFRPFWQNGYVFFKTVRFQGIGKHVQGILNNFVRSAVKQVVDKTCQVDVSGLYRFKAHQGMVD